MGNTRREFFWRLLTPLCMAGVALGVPKSSSGFTTMPIDLGYGPICTCITMPLDKVALVENDPAMARDFYRRLGQAGRSLLDLAKVKWGDVPVALKFADFDGKMWLKSLNEAGYQKGWSCVLMVEAGNDKWKYMGLADPLGKLVAEAKKRGGSL